MEPQGREQAEHCLGNPPGHDLQIDVLTNGCGRQAIEPPLQTLQQAPLAQAGQGADPSGGPLNGIQARLELKPTLSSGPLVSPSAIRGAS